MPEARSDRAAQPGRIGYILMLSFGLSVLTFVTPR